MPSYPTGMRFSALGTVVLWTICVMAQSRGELLVAKLELGNEKFSHSATTERLPSCFLWCGKCEDAREGRWSTDYNRRML